MTITSIIVVYAVLWFLCLFVILPQRIVTQGEAGDVAPGTPSSAPSDPMMGRKLRWTTIAATILWAIVCAIILSGVVTAEDIAALG